jgi:uncharacterized protein YabE (DUF348 family)
MTKSTGYLVALALALLGMLLAYAGLQRPVTLFLNGQPLVIQSRAVTSGGVLRVADIIPSPSDRLSPPAGAWLGWNAAVRFDRAVPVTLWSGGAAKPVFLSAERLPANLLALAGIRLYPDDRILWNGQAVPHNISLPPVSSFTLQVRQAVRVELVDGGAMRVFYSASPTLGLALWDAGIHLLQGDHLSLPLNTPLLTPVVLTLRRALPITIQTGAVQVTALSAAPAVGEALAESGLSLQGSDYSQPAEDQPIPPDGLIRIVRVREEVLLQQTTIPFENEYVSDPQTPLDQTSVVQAGQAGLLVSRVRVRYEDGTETGRQTEAQWTANQPVTQKIGTGSKINVQTLDTPGGPIEYWRAVNVYATSYSPCRSGTSKCYGFTASGQPVTRGVIGVTTRWYSVMGGQQVYIPGYGRAVIADTGGGIPGKKWIDLGFSDDDYESWAQNVTLYFLTPIPANVPYILP